MGEGDVQEAETEEFKRAVDRFDQLYQEEENTVVTSSSKQETEQVVVTKRQKKNKKKNTESCTESVSVEEQESTQVSQEKEWKQIKKGKSFEESPESEEKEENKGGKCKDKNSSKKKRGRIEGNVEISLDDVHAIAKNISPDEGAAAASAEDTQTQGSSAQSERDFAKEDGDFTEFQKKLIQKTQEAQDSIQSTLIDMETDRMESEVMRVQRHSLCLDGGVMVERTTTTLARTESEDCTEERSTASLAHTESEESKEEESQIDPDSLKNVDGHAKVGFIILIPITQICCCRQGRGVHGSRRGRTARASRQETA